MELANCRLLQANGDCVPLRAVTPAQLLVLVKMHKDRAKNHPILDLKIIGTAQSVEAPEQTDEVTGKVTRAATYRPRTGPEEMARLRTLYHKKWLETIFPSPTSPVPEAFADVDKLLAIPTDITEPGVAGSWTDVPGQIPGEKSAPVLVKAKPA